MWGGHAFFVAEALLRTICRQIARNSMLPPPRCRGRPSVTKAAPVGGDSCRARETPVSAGGHELNAPVPYGGDSLGHQPSPVGVL